MTLLEHRAATAPGGAAFDFDELADVGLVFAPEQQWLWRHQVDDRHRGAMALMVGFLPDPEHERSGMPMVCLDDDGYEHLAVFPAIVELDEDLGGWVAEGESFERFPTLSGRHLMPVASTDFGDDVDLDSPMGIRLWHLWPINRMEAEDVLDAVRVWKSANYDLFSAYYAADLGDIDACDIVDRNEGIGYDEHTHLEHTDASGDVIVIQCLDGDEWLERFQAGHFRLDEDGGLRPKPLRPFRFCDPDMQARWEQLQASSQMASHRAITLFDPSEREHILRTERYYSPWLWLS